MLSLAAAVGCPRAKRSPELSPFPLAKIQPCELSIRIDKTGMRQARLPPLCFSSSEIADIEVCTSDGIHCVAMTCGRLWNATKRFDRVHVPFKFSQNAPASIDGDISSSKLSASEHSKALVCISSS